MCIFGIISRSDYRRNKIKIALESARRALSDELSRLDPALIKKFSTKILSFSNGHNFFSVHRRDKRTSASESARRDLSDRLSNSKTKIFSTFVTKWPYRVTETCPPFVRRFGNKS